MFFSINNSILSTSEIFSFGFFSSSNKYKTSSKWRVHGCSSSFNIYIQHLLKFGYFLCYHFLYHHTVWRLTNNNNNNIICTHSKAVLKAEKVVNITTVHRKKEFRGFQKKRFSRLFTLCMLVTILVKFQSAIYIKMDNSIDFTIKISWKSQKNVKIVEKNNYFCRFSLK